MAEDRIIELEGISRTHSEQERSKQQTTEGSAENETV